MKLILKDIAILLTIFALIFFTVKIVLAYEHQKILDINDMSDRLEIVTHLFHMLPNELIPKDEMNLAVQKCTALSLRKNYPGPSLPASKIGFENYICLPPKLLLSKDDNLGYKQFCKIIHMKFISQLISESVLCGQKNKIPKYVRKDYSYILKI